MSAVRILVLGMLVVTACAEPLPPTDSVPTGAPPSVAQLICEPDGRTRVVTPEARVQPDGIHVHVQVLLDEPVVLDGLWLDRRVGPGEADIVTLNPPGVIDVACWPVSQLDSESFEPVRVEIRMMDPNRIYVSEELDCLAGDDTAGWTTDFGARGPDIEPPITSMQAEAILSGLEAGDAVNYVGYPEDPLREIAVVRDGRTIAVMSFMHVGGELDSYDGGICEGEPILPPGIE
jgi:hypothetical protein